MKVKTFLQLTAVSRKLKMLASSSTKLHLLTILDVRSKAAQVPLKRFGTPEEVAEAVWFLATNRYANNCVLNLDGGLSAV